MLRTCPYCGRIHDANAICKRKQEAIDKRNARRGDSNTPEARFRNTSRWRKVREAVYHRDRFLCLCCLAELEGTQNKYTTDDLSVHHIEPLKENMSRRSDTENLITVCRVHHEMCEDGTIPRDVQHKLAEWSECGAMDLKERMEIYKAEQMVK